MTIVSTFSGMIVDELEQVHFKVYSRLSEANFLKKLFRIFKYSSLFSHQNIFFFFCVFIISSYFWMIVMKSFNSTTPVLSKVESCSSLLFYAEFNNSLFTSSLVFSSYCFWLFSVPIIKIIIFNFLFVVLKTVRHKLQWRQQ